MPLTAEMIDERVREALPDASIIIEDMRGDGGHFAVTVTSAAFNGQPRLQQHRMIYEALGKLTDEELQTLSLRTCAAT